MNAPDPMLSLEPPTPIGPVTAAEAYSIVPIAEETKAQQRTSIERYVAELASLPVDGPEFAVAADRACTMGRREIAAAAHGSIRPPVRAVANGEIVGVALSRLRIIVDELDPAQAGHLAAPRHILGITLNWKIRSYFARYEAAGRRLNEVLRLLADSRDAALRENIAIDSGRRRMWRMLEELQEVGYALRTLDATLDRTAADLDASSPGRAQALRGRVQFHARQRRSDVLTQMSISLQDYLALDLVRRTNVELIRAIDGAATTTVSALRTAISVAQAVAGHKLVLEQIRSVGDNSANKGNTRNRITEPDHEPVTLDTLRLAFADVRATLDEVEDFQGKARNSLEQTTAALETVHNRKPAI